LYSAIKQDVTLWSVSNIKTNAFSVQRLKLTGNVFITKVYWTAVPNPWFEADGKY